MLISDLGSKSDSWVLLGVLHEREPDLDRHLQGVALLAASMGRELQLDAEDLDVLIRAGELHDVGKVAIPDEILHKAGPLSDAERELMQKHPVIGERVLAAAPAMKQVARLVRSSHERWDGGGYPDGLCGEETPLGSRIISICDAYNAIRASDPREKRRAPRRRSRSCAAAPAPSSIQPSSTSSSAR